MKKIINRPEDFVVEYMQGIALAHPDKVKLLNDDFRILVRANKAKEKVRIVTAGGSGHLPVFLGYVGEGLLDGCAVGDVFASPSASKMAEMIRHADTGKGVLCLFGNYGGDKMNFSMARDEVEFDDIVTQTVLVRDDVASASVEKKDTRRGVAGMVYAFKVAGAAAEKGYSLDEVVTVTQRALDNIGTMGVALSACIVPTVGKPTFSIEDGKMEVGMGIHGEAGIDVVDIMSADEVAKVTFDKINAELNLKENDRVSVMVNGLGATPLEELYIVYRALKKQLSDLGVKDVHPHIGEYATSMEMAGLSVTIFKLDDELEQLLSYPAHSPFYRMGS